MKDNKNVALVVSGSYDRVSVGLFQNTTLVAQKNEKVRASSHLLSLVESVLSNAGCALREVDRIIVDQGPGAFTSLRAVITTMNGVAVATGISLHGVDGLVSLGHFVRKSRPDACTRVMLFNAYNKEFYYLIESDGHESQVGYGTVEHIVSLLHSLSPSTLFFAGSGAALCRTELDPLFSYAQWGGSEYDTAPFESLFVCADAQASIFLTPRYLKEQTFKVT